MAINPIQFPEYTNAQINAALLADKVNEVIGFLNDKYPDPKPDNAFVKEEGYLGQYTEQIFGTLKEGVTMTKNGRYMLEGRFIKKEEAYAQEK